MSADKKPKRRQKKNSEVSQFVTRFRVQPPETHSAPEPHSSQGALKFFHWKYNEEDSIITDDATSVPTYPDQDLPQRRYPSSNTYISQPQYMKTSQGYAPRAQRWIQDITMDQQMAQASQAPQHPAVSQMADNEAIARQQSRQQQLELLYKQRGLPVPIQAEPQQPAWNKAAVAESYAQQYFGAAPMVDVSTFLPWMSPAAMSAPATPSSDAMDIDSDYSHSSKTAKILPAIPEKRVPLGAQHISFPDGTSNIKVPVGGSFTPSQHSAFKPIPSHHHLPQPTVRQGL